MVELLKPERVYFVGAGASKAIYPDLPLANGLTLQSLLDHDDPVYKTNAAKSLVEVDRLLTRSPGKLGSKPIEEVLSKVAQQDRVYIIQCILYRLALFDRPPCAPLQNWLTQLPIRCHAIVTTNYDTVFERNLRRLHDLGLGVRGGLAWLDYGISADLCVKQGSSVWRRCESDRPLLLLKLHGSISWTRCLNLNCGRYMLYPTYAFAGAYAMNDPVLKSERCPDCGDDPWSVLIPPVIHKKYNDRALQQVWDRAEEILRNAEEIVFAGYSLPPTDDMVRKMLLRSHKSGNTKKVSVVDQNFAAIAERFRGIYGHVVCEASDWRGYLEQT